MSMKKTIVKIIANASFKQAEKDVNSACAIIYNQSKIPNAAKKLRKF